MSQFDDYAFQKVKHLAWNQPLSKKYGGYISFHDTAGVNIFPSILKSPILYFHNFENLPQCLVPSNPQHTKHKGHLLVQIVLYLKYIYVNMYVCTQLRTPFTFSSNTHLFKGTKGHFYQFRNKHLIFWVITNCTFLLF